MKKNRFYLTTYIALCFKYLSVGIGINIENFRDTARVKRVFLFSYEYIPFDYWLRWEKIRLLHEKIGDKWQWMKGDEILAYKL